MTIDLLHKIKSKFVDGYDDEYGETSNITNNTIKKVIKCVDHKSHEVRKVAYDLLLEIQRVVEYKSINYFDCLIKLMKTANENNNDYYS